MSLLVGTSMASLWEGGAEFDGILGLGLTSIVPDSRSEKTVLSNLNVDKFGLCLGNDDDHITSRLYWNQFPDYNWQFIQGIGKQHWAVKVPQFGLKFQQTENNTETTFPCSVNGCAAIVDSGTSAIAGPMEQLGQILDIVDKTVGGFKEDCSNYDQLPDLTFYLEDKKFVIKPASYIKRAILKTFTPSTTIMEDGMKKIIRDPPNEKEVCLPLFVDTPLGDSPHGPVWILGQPFMREYMVMYDRAENKLGFANNDPESSCPDLGGDDGVSGGESEGGILHQSFVMGKKVRKEKSTASWITERSYVSGEL